MTEHLTITEKITKAKIKLNHDTPFFSYVVMNLKFHENEKIAQGTIAVNAKGNIYYSKKFVEKLDLEELKFIISHETMHCLFLTFTRLGNRDKKVWNRCTDLVNNTILKNHTGFDDYRFKILKGSIVANQDDEYINENILIKEVSKKTTEQVYDEMEKQIQKNQTDKSSFSKGDFDKHLYGEDSEDSGEELNAHEKKELEDKWKSVLTEAYYKSKLAGENPLGMEIFIDGLLNPKMNWKALLQKYIVKEIPHDSTFMLPSRRSVATGFYMPSVTKETVNIGVAVDTSGSVSPKELKHFLSEVVSISKSYDSVNMKLLTHDYVIQDKIEVKNSNINKIMNMKIHGGGGTSHKEILEYVKKNNIKVMVCFTDLYSDLEDLKPPNNTVFIFISTSNLKAPFGVTIPYEVKGVNDEFS